MNPVSTPTTGRGSTPRNASTCPGEQLTTVHFSATGFWQCHSLLSKLLVCIPQEFLHMGNAVSAFMVLFVTCSALRCNQWYFRLNFRQHTITVIKLFTRFTACHIQVPFVKYMHVLLFVRNSAISAVGQIWQCGTAASQHSRHCLLRVWLGLLSVV